MLMVGIFLVLCWAVCATGAGFSLADYMNGGSGWRGLLAMVLFCAAMAFLNTAIIVFQGA